MTADRVSLEFTDDGIAILTMKNGENRLNLDFIRLLNNSLDAVLGNTSCKALLTIGEGKFYSNGADVEWMMKQSMDTTTDFAIKLTELYWRLMHFPIPTVAVLNGHTFAGGAFLAFAHDYRVMNSKRGWISVNEARIGLTIPRAILEILRIKVNATSSIREVAIYARSIPASEAKSLGLVDEVAEPSILMSVGKQLALQALGDAVIDRNMLEKMKKDLYPRTVSNTSDSTVKSML